MDKQKIINKHFQRSFLGYDVEEVDAFLDEIIRDMERAEQEMGIARLRIRMLLEELETHGLLKCRRGDGAEKAGDDELVCEPVEPEADEPAKPANGPEEPAVETKEPAAETEEPADGATDEPAVAAQEAADGGSQRE